MGMIRWNFSAVPRWNGMNSTVNFQFQTAFEHDQQVRFRMAVRRDRSLLNLPEGAYEDHF